MDGGDAICVGAGLGECEGDEKGEREEEVHVVVCVVERGLWFG